MKKQQLIDETLAYIESGGSIIGHTVIINRIIRDLIAQRDMAAEALEWIAGYDGNQHTTRKAEESLAKIKSGEWLETTVQHNTKYEG